MKDLRMDPTLSLLSVNNIPFSSAVCLESCFSNPFQRQTIQGGQFLTVVVNTAWFQQFKVARQHLYAGQLRAAEMTRYLIQSSNNGYSAIISPRRYFISQ